MSTTKKAPVLVVVQLSGGNDFMNTLIPYTSGIYYDSRPVVGIKAEDVIPLDVDDALGWNPHAAPLKEMFDAGDVAVVQGIGYPDSNRSHFRAMDIWHTCEPLKIGDEGVGRQTCPGTGSSKPECANLRQFRAGTPTRLRTLRYPCYVRWRSG